MFQGMTIGEQRALLVLAVIIADGLGVQAWRGEQGRAPLRVERSEKIVAPGPETTPAAYQATSNVSAVEPTPSPHPSSLDDHGRLNINRATVEELMQYLPGIGEVRAKSIVEHRKKKGPFRRVEDLNQVYGIGEKTLERIHPLAFAGRVARNDTQ